jgi:hypothetical protein
VSGLVESLNEVIPPNLLREVERVLINGWRREEILAKAEAKQTAAYNHANAASNIDGVGQMIARIPPSSYHYWGKRLGYQCWDDDQFLREFLRDNEEVAVKNYAKKTVVNGAIFTADGFLT